MIQQPSNHLIHHGEHREHGVQQNTLSSSPSSVLSVRSVVQ